jgi:hypothetical protein
MIKMSSLCAVALAATACGSYDPAAPAEEVGSTQQKTIYGADNRVEYPAITNPRLRTRADATAALFGTNATSCSGSTCNLTALSAFTTATTPSGTRPLCNNVRFKNQLAGAFCSGFLVAPNVVATAGHCVTGLNVPIPACTNLSLVFGFNADANGNTVTSVPSRDVYRCVGTPKGLYTNSEDWALVQLDRNVTGRTPMIAQYSGPLMHRELAAFGYGLGLPLKMARDAHVKGDDPADPGHFLISSDIFPGNSGGPAVDVTSSIATGLATNAPGHFVDASDGKGGLCAALQVCSDAPGSTGCPGWILYTRMTHAARQGKLPLHSALVSTVL